MLVLFFPTVESFSVVARALHILSDLYLFSCGKKDLHSIIVKKELCMANLLYISSYSQKQLIYTRTLQFVPGSGLNFSRHVQIFLMSSMIAKYSEPRMHLSQYELDSTTFILLHLHSHQYTTNRI